MNREDCCLQFTYYRNSIDVTWINSESATSIVVRALHSPCLEPPGAMKSVSLLIKHNGNLSCVCLKHTLARGPITSCGGDKMNGLSWGSESQVIK